MSLVAGDAGAQAPPALVAEYGGRAFARGQAFVLDSSPSMPRVVAVDVATLQWSERRLEPGDHAVAAYGVVVSGSGDSWVLADKGRRLLRFASSGGKPIEDRHLPAPCVGIWGLDGKVILAPLQSGGRQPLLVSLEGSAFRPFGQLAPRDATTPETRIVANMLRCGPETAGQLPCWHIAQSEEVFWLRPDGRLRRTRIQTLAQEPEKPRSSSLAAMLASWSFPIRDVHPIDDENAWILTNQEGRVPPNEPGAVRGRHLLFVKTAGGASLRRVPLPREAKAILGGSATGAVVLYADGGVGRVTSPGAPSR
jgi:hypothetical protein